MSASHKEALAKGRDEGRAIRLYLDALQSQRPSRGRPRSKESMEKRLAAIEARIPTADSLAKLRLHQDRLRLKEQLGNTGKSVDMAELEKQFVKVAKGYAERKHIGYAAWRAVGVDPKVLEKAGITKSAKI